MQTLKRWGLVLAEVAAVLALAVWPAEATTKTEPAFMNTATVSIGVDFTVVMQNTGVYRLYGISVQATEQN